MWALEGAKKRAFPPGQYVAQESFIGADEILWLARAGGVKSGSRVLDLCCGIGGPALYLVERTGCELVGLDLNEASIYTARKRAQERGLAAEFEVREVPPEGTRTFNAVMLLETLLAFPDKRALVTQIHRSLDAGGVFLFTLEEGRPLTQAEARLMPRSDTVWLTPLEDMTAILEDSGFQVEALLELTESHRRVAERLASEYQRQETEIADELGRLQVKELIKSHRLWSQWMSKGRVRKYAIVAGKRPRSLVDVERVAGPGDVVFPDLHIDT